MTSAAFIITAMTHAPGRAVVLSACVIALAQITLSSYARTFSHRNLALWFEGLSIYGMAVASLSLALLGLTGLSPLAILSSVVAAIFVTIALTLFARLKQADLVARLHSAVQIGLPLLAFTLSSIWASISGRIYIGAFLSIQDLSVYSVAFRVASAILVAHSVIGTGLFARLYNMRTRLYDRWLSLYLVGLGVLAVLMVPLFPVLLAHIGFRSIGPEQVPLAITLFPIVVLQVYAWGAWASLEMRLARAGRSGPAAKKAIILIAGIAIVVAGLRLTGVLTVNLCAGLMAAQMLGGVAIQFHILWRRGMKMRLSAIAFASTSLAIALCPLIVSR
jgi:O-antigen/teichoic acid export membrane protein